MSVDNEWASFLEEFKVEAREHLRALNTQLLQLERDPGDPRPVREMFLSAHTIKGGAAMLEIADVRELAHRLEDVLATLRDRRRPLDGPLADLLFQALDALRDLVDRAVPGGGTLSGAYAAVAAALSAYGEEDARAAPAATTAPASVTPVRPRVLLVEDSTTVRLLESMLLQDAGFDVDAVGDGRDALQRTRDQTYALLVTGVETRGLRGLDLVDAVRQTPGGAQLPIVVMSSDDNPEHRGRAAEVGVQAYIRKGSLGQRRLVEAARELVQVPGSP